jgi:hypothetical protein
MEGGKYHNIYDSIDNIIDDMDDIDDIDNIDKELDKLLDMDSDEI